MKTFLSLLVCFCALGVTQALADVNTSWEYARLTENDSSLIKARWSSSRNDNLEARSFKELAAAMKKSRELADYAKAENLNQLLQALGSQGWELVQVERIDYPDFLTKSRIYYFKRQL
jgi:chemotaxis regulatin CheY-phosphate phosphatase CheZ